MIKLKFSLLITIFLLSNLTYSQSIDYLDSINGYKDLKFGMTKTELKDRIFDCSNQGHCLMMGNKYETIRNVKVKTTFTKFVENKLFAIYLIIEGQDNVDNLLDIYVETFGKASYSEKEKEGPIVYWEANNVLLSFDIDIDNKGNVGATVIIVSKKLMDRNSQSEIKKNLDGL